VKKEYSLKGRKLFQEVFHQGKKYRGSALRIFVLKIHEPDIPDIFTDNRHYKIKIGIGIGRRFGTAVQRNRAKRIVRSIIQESLHEMKDGYVIIIKPDERLKEMTHFGITSELRNLLKKSGVLAS